MYPSIIVDNFFPNPDEVVKFAKMQTFHPNDGTYPGKRTYNIVELDKDLYEFIFRKINNIFYCETNYRWVGNCYFQLIEPFTKNQYDAKNIGWVHYDTNYQFGGIIYLNKNPEKDTGTVLYKEKCGFSNITNEKLKLKFDHYTGESVDDEEYENALQNVNSKFEETVVVSNVYNRMLLFGSNVPHAVQTYGNLQDRLTIAFFCRTFSEINPPLFR